ncbi:Tyrosine recombinase XerC [Sporotomaculum syntrophicum]|uniref:Tyrosine recombinase XerC n=1 Tax=Sporotomaculum syntrophicum TaxID=182264 RepID=A0A9D2WQC0_9FIRM|nr:tyrosine-type recombinase/integrase [Sporotomaculum syntrophicum]KAF1085682.1 Tyrosine recombinase XerC [Sporotomaculum syntrophicum]
MTNELEKYLKDLEAEGKSEKTIISYRTTIQQFISWYEDSNEQQATIERITPMDIKDYKQYLIITKERKPATVNKIIVTLKSFFGWAVENGISNINPARKIKLQERQKLAPKWLDRNEQNKLLREVEKEKNELKKVRDIAIIQMMLQTGLRVEEVTELEITDIEVNCKSGKVIVRHGKRNKYREVPLNKDARNALKDYLKERQDHKYSDSKYLFISERSPQMTTRAIQHMVEHYGERAKIEKLTCHILRHTFCHNLIIAGAGIEKVAMLAGHSSLESSKIYTVPGEKELQDIVEKISIND